MLEMEVSGMSGNQRYLKKEQRKKMIMRVLAGVLCVGLLAMMVLPYLPY